MDNAVPPRPNASDPTQPPQVSQAREAQETTEGPQPDSADRRNASNQDDAAGRLAPDNRWLLRANGALVLLTAISVLVSALSVRAANRSADIADATLKSTQRPWVALRVEGLGPLTVTAKDIAIRLQVSIRNTGPTPATNAMAHPVIFVSERQPMDSGEIIARRCANFFSPGGKKGGLGHVLFPGDRVSEDTTVSTPRAELGDARSFPVYLLICTHYGSPLTKQSHRTASLFTAIRLDPQRQGAYAITTDGGTLSPKALQLVPLGSYAD
jgi:hypothetical protein